MYSDAVKAGGGFMYLEDEYLMLSGIQHFAYCRRQWALIHVEQQWEENYQTTSGELLHKRAHNEQSFEKRGDKMTARGLRIASESLGISGQCDIVEFHAADDGINVFGYEGKWKVVPVEYKNGVPKEGNEDLLQLCAQAICLEEMFLTEIPKGYLYYGQNRRREEVVFSRELRQEVRKLFEEMHQLFRRGYTPKVKAGKKCRNCSLANICLPRIQGNKSVSAYINDTIKNMEGEA